MSERIDFDKPVTIKTDDFIAFGRAFRLEDGEVFYFRSDKPLMIGEEVFLKVELPRAKVPLSCYVTIERTGASRDGMKGFVGRLCRIAPVDAKRFDHWLKFMSSGGSSLRPELVVDEEGDSFDKRMTSASNAQVRSELKRLDEALGTTRRSRDPYGFARSDRTRKPVDAGAIMAALAGVDRGAGRRVVRKRVVTGATAQGALALDVEALELDGLLSPLPHEGGVQGVDYDELLEEAEADNRLDALLDEAVGAEEEGGVTSVDELVDDDDSWGEIDDASSDAEDVIVSLDEDQVSVRWVTVEALARDFESHLRQKRLRVPGSAPSKGPGVRLILPDGQILALRSRLLTQESDHFELKLDLQMASKGKLKRAAYPNAD